MGINSLRDEPATINLSLPNDLPRSVNGRRLGMIRLGMISCCGGASGAWTGGAGSPSSSLEAMALLLLPSMSSSEWRKDRIERDFGLLGTDDPNAWEANDMGVRGCEMPSGGTGG
jgi:hypothetical protein